MEHEDLMTNLELCVGDFRFQPDQGKVMHAYHEKNGRVAVGAGAGTGKTTILTRVVAEAVVRNCAPEPSTLNDNPFEDILVTTFSRDAAGQLKSNIKDILREHEIESDDEFDQDLWRWAETASEIGTIDSFVQDLLREIAADIGVNPRFNVRDQLKTEDIRREIFKGLREDPELAEAIDLLQDELNDENTTSRSFVYDIHQKLREFCYEFESETTMFSSKFRKELHQDCEPPFEPTDVIEIISQLTNNQQMDATPPDNATLTGIEADFQYNIAFLEALEDVIDAFDDAYDRHTREIGALSYTDITYLVWKYLDSDAGTDFANSLQSQFAHVFIDEFQDTSYAQCQILSHVISNDDSTQQLNNSTNSTRTKVLVIGDVKQSIYGWRSADPEIFSDILAHADRGTTAPDQYLGVDEWTRAELTTNFRSHPQLVRAANHLFSQLFTDPGRGDIGSFDVRYQSLHPFREELQPDESHLHVLPLGDGNADALRTRESHEVAAAIHGILEEGTVKVEEETEFDDRTEEATTRPAKAGDFTLLFRRSTHIQSFRSALDNHGIQNAVVAESGLFETEEVGFLIAVLDWFANPHSKESLLRILRSPVTALSDVTLRYAVSNELDLPGTLEAWPADDLPESDRTRLQHLVDLRSDLRWDREGSKATLIQKIIQHTALETILLTGEDARQRYGNLWMLVEVTRDWEDEELLPYREFVNRLHRYQELARGSSGEFEVAPVADSQADDTVKLRTVHSAKGLEFGIVVLADLLAGPGGSPSGETFLSLKDANRRELVIHPRSASNPVPYNPGPGSYWIHSDQTSSIWMSNARTDNGTFRHSHPFNAALADQFAEYWRLLYVAFTRAKDHIIAPLGNDLHHSYRWSTWAKAFNLYLRPDDQWDHGQINIPLVGNHPADTDHDSQLTINVGQLPFADPIDPDPIGLPLEPNSRSNPTERDSMTSKNSPSDSLWTGVDFAPRTLNPSTLHDIIACPRRFQYRSLQEVSEIRGTSPPETNNPDGTSPSSWGRIVHQALEHLHRDHHKDALGTADSTFTSYLRGKQDIRPEIETVVRQYRKTSTWAEVQEATKILPEYELSALHPAEPQVHIQGFVDLLYENDSKWYIIDFKTGRVPDKETHLANQYRWQLATYAWLLREEYGIDVAEARVVYLQDGTEVNHDIDWKLFASYLHDLNKRLPVSSGAGLPLRPDPDPDAVDVGNVPEESRCGTCPYISICPAWQS